MASELREFKVESKGESYEVVLHVQRGSGFKNIKKAHIQAVDDIIWDQVEQVAKKFAPSTSSEQPHESLRNALTKDTTWEELEEEFTQSDFWIRSGEPQSTKDSFVAHKEKSGFKGMVKRAFASKADLFKKQIEKSAKYIPDAKTWFEQLVNDSEVRSCLHINVNKVWEEIVSLRDLWLDANGVAVGKKWDDNNMHEKEFLDIGFISFPDWQEPQVKVFRLKLTVWSQFDPKAKTLSSGIRGDLTTCVFRPRDHCLEAIKAVVKEIQQSGGATRPSSGRKQRWKMVLNGEHEAVEILRSG